MASSPHTLTNGARGRNPGRTEKLANSQPDTDSSTACGSWCCTRTLSVIAIKALRLLCLVPFIAALSVCQGIPCSALHSLLKFDQLFHSEKCTSFLAKYSDSAGGGDSGDSGAAAGNII